MIYKKKNFISNYVKLLFINKIGQLLYFNYKNKNNTKLINFINNIINL